MSLRRHFGEQTLSATEANGHTSKQVIIHEKFADNFFTHFLVCKRSSGEQSSESGKFTF